MKTIARAAPVRRRHSTVAYKPTTQGASSRATLARMRLASLLTDRVNLAQSLNRTIYNGLRNVWRVSGYPDTDKISTVDYYDKYRRGDIGSKLLTFYPSYTWDDNIEIVQDRNNVEPTEFDRAVIALWDKFDLWNVLLRADIMSGIGQDGWSIIFIGSDDNEDFSQPLERGELLYLTPYSQRTAKVEAEEKDTTSERFGEPVEYSIKGMTTLTNKVHWSRVIHVTNNLFEGRYKGLPELERGWNKLIDLDKVTAGGAEATWRNADPLKHFNTTGDNSGLSSGEEFDDDDFEALRDEIDDWIHNLQTALITHDVDSKLLSGSVPKIKDNAELIVSLLAAAYSIPKGELLGSQAGALASSEEDTKRVNKRLRDRQTEKAVPLIRKLVDKFMSMGVLPEVASYEVILPPLDEPSEEDKANRAKSLAEANKAQSEASGQIILSGEEIRREIWDLDPLDESQQPAPQVATTTQLRAAADEPNNPDWKAVHRVADENVNMLADSIADVFGASSEAVTSIESAADEAMGSFEQLLNDLLPDQLLGILVSAGEAVLEGAKSRGSFYRTARQQGRNLQAEMVFDAENPRAVQWALDRSGQLITEIGPDTRDGIQLIIAEGQARNLTKQEIIRRVRQAVGLRSDQVNALYGFMDRLALAEAGDQVFMGVQRGEEIWITVPRSGVTRALEIKYYNQYANLLRIARARLIARTETLRSANYGQRELWFQAQDIGELSKTAKRVWIATPDDRTRDTHAEWDGAVAGVNEPFEFGVEPGEEPNCRCGQGLVN